jgi:hypothetical protein
MTPEQENRLHSLIDDIIKEANEGQAICECGQQSLNREITLEALGELVYITFNIHADFLEQAMNVDANLHLSSLRHSVKPALH